MVESVGAVLSRDVALGGGPYSPLLSWLGSAALILFVMWQAARLCLDIRGAQTLCTDIDETVSRLVKDRRLNQPDPLAHHHQASRLRTFDQRNSRDLDDLASVDRLMERDMAVSSAWRQYRQTLVLERVAWFQEPHIFSTRHVEEYFTFDRLFGRRVDRAWYAHVPSLVTGVSLLLTFMALLAGLSHLHADARGIQGIQGFINGLSRKFLTSVVGLVAANVFSVIEKQVLYRLTNAHQQLVDSLEALFPRKILEQWLEEYGASAGLATEAGGAGTRSDSEASIHTLAVLIRDLGHAITAQTRVLEAQINKTSETLGPSAANRHIRHHLPRRAPAAVGLDCAPMSPDTKT